MNTTIEQNRAQALHELRFGDWVQIRHERAPMYYKETKERCAMGVIAEALEVDPFVSTSLLGSALGTPTCILCDVETRNDIDRCSFSEIADYLENWWKEHDGGVPDRILGLPAKQ